MNHSLTSTPIGDGGVDVAINSDEALLERAMHIILAAFGADRMGVDLELVDPPTVTVTIGTSVFGSSSLHPIVINHSELMLVVITPNSSEREPEESEAYMFLLERYGVGNDGLAHWRTPEGAKLVHLNSWGDVGLEPFYRLSPAKLLSLLMD